MTDFLAADTDEAIRDLQSVLDNSPATGVTTLSVSSLRMWQRALGQHRSRDKFLAAELAALADEIAFDAGAWMPSDERNDTMTAYAARLRAMAAELRGMG